MKSPAQAEDRFESWFRSIFIDGIDCVEPPVKAEAPVYIRRLFDEFEKLTHALPVEVVASGLERLIDQGRSDEMHSLMDDSLPLEIRVAAVDSLRGLLRYFEAHCAPVPGHELENSRTPINKVCYQWWDRFPAFPMPDNPKRKPVEAAFIRHMSDALKSNSLAVQEYGLHGLGHWHHDYSNEVEAAVDDYLNRNSKLDAAMKSYAASARAGMVS